MTERRGPLSRFLFKEYQQFLLELATMREERRLSDRLLQVIDLGEKAVVHVLSGGGALALMHIGVLVAIREEHEQQLFLPGQLPAKVCQ